MTGIRLPLMLSPDGPALCVGSEANWRDVIARSGLSGDVCFVDFEDVTQTLMDDVQPSAVYSPLFGDGFDSTDLACLLESLGFRGMYCAVTSSLPKPSIITTEVQTLAPKLQYDLLVYEEVPRRRLN